MRKSSEIGQRAGWAGVAGISDHEWNAVTDVGNDFLLAAGQRTSWKSPPSSCRVNWMCAKGDAAAGFALLQNAVNKEHALGYTEPP